MSAMEQSLRRALEGGDAGDPAFREAIYLASERALERMIEGRGMDEAEAQAQRIRLAETINRVEDDYFAAHPHPPVAEGAAPHAQEFFEHEPAFGGDGEPAASAGGNDAFADSVSELQQETRAQAASDAATHDERRSEAADRPPARTFVPSTLSPSRNSHDDGEGDPPFPAVVASRPKSAQSRGKAASTDNHWSPGKDARASASRRGGRKLAFAAVTLGLLLLLILWFVYGVVFGTSRSAGASAGAAETTVSQADWIAIFDGSRLETITTPTGGRVEAVSGTGAVPAVRIASVAAGSEVLVAAGPGVVQRLKGRKVRVELTAGSPDGAPREFGVRCLFGTDAAVCGRQRFTTGQGAQPFIFDMDVPDDATASGNFAIDPGFGAARDLDLYAIRLRLL